MRKKKTLIGREHEVYCVLCDTTLASMRISGPVELFRRMTEIKEFFLSYPGKMGRLQLEEDAYVGWIEALRNNSEKIEWPPLG